MLRLGWREHRHVCVGDLSRGAFLGDPSAVEQNRAVAERSDYARIMTDHDSRLAAVPKAAKALLAPPAEAGVADRKNLIQNQDAPKRVEGDRVREPRGHTTREVFQLQVRETLHLRECEDLVHA